MNDDLVERLREVGRDGVWKSGRNPASAHPMCIEAADRIEVKVEIIKTLRSEIERLKDQLSVEAEPSPYCPICGSCGDDGCCASKRCMYPVTGIEALSAENERLRETLSAVTNSYDHWSAVIAARAAL